MSRKCYVCNHYYVKEINIRLLNRGRTKESFREIAREYEGVSETALRRHFFNHLGGSDICDISTKETAVPLTLNDMLNDATDMYSRTVKGGDSQSAIRALSLIVDLKKLLNSEEELAIRERELLRDTKVILKWGDIHKCINYKGEATECNDINDASIKPDTPPDDRSESEILENEEKVLLENCPAGDINEDVEKSGKNISQNDKKPGDCGSVIHKNEDENVVFEDENERVEIVDGVTYRTLKPRKPKPGDEIPAKSGDSLTEAFLDAMSYSW